MTDKEKLEAVISELKSCIESLEACFSGKFPMVACQQVQEQDKGQLKAYKSMIAFIESLQEEPFDYTNANIHQNDFAEPVSDDLEKELVSYHNEHFSPCEDGTLLSEETGQELSWNDYEQIARHFANWQKQQEYTCYEEAFEDGCKWIKEQMMKNAVEWLRNHTEKYIWWQLRVFATDRFVEDFKQAMEE